MCGVCVGMCGCEKITRPTGKGCVTREVPWAEVRPVVRFRPAPHWSARDAFWETNGGLVVQDKDRRVVKDSVSTDRAG